MARTRSFCPNCGRIVEAGKRCDCLPKRKRKPTSGDATRKEREPWRAAYDLAEYRKARQVAMSRTGGRCVDCGKVCARLVGSRWYAAEYGGEVDHVRALSEGGSNSADNLQLRCKSCHAKRDAARRRAAGS